MQNNMKNLKDTTLSKIVMQPKEKKLHYTKYKMNQKWFNLEDIKGCLLRVKSREIEGYA